MAAPQLNEAETARVALDEIWRQVAPEVDRAKAYETVASSSVADDPMRDVYLRWLELFGSEIAAVQQLQDLIARGARVETDDVRLARRTGERLVELIQTGRARVTSEFSSAA